MINFFLKKFSCYCGEDILVYCFQQEIVSGIKMYFVVSYWVLNSSEASKYQFYFIYQIRKQVTPAHVHVHLEKCQGEIPHTLLSCGDATHVGAIPVGE